MVNRLSIFCGDDAPFDRFFDRFGWNHANGPGHGAPTLVGVEIHQDPRLGGRAFV